MAEPTARASIEIAASPAAVYDLVSDVTTLPEWAAETERCTWLGGADRAAVGAQFRGRNKHKGRPWGTTCTVTAADPGKRFAFGVRVAGLPSAKWSYDIEPTEGGCRVTESTTRLAPRPLALVANRVLFGIPDRDKHNQANIEKTLAQLKKRAEATA
ncbi:polyketide cyclase/dehydrase/lipid transport protein [Herbihabitans rhizosphaerae]|uniref:Polyketide cyclase/dehydrase/lipid transport protein n=1 Tax=Herbihabitans rhizosphaerae TaxID=1872711 RepID=A0A4Q7KLR7_9PSEU|nr:SRPBCC family protein [Herbihabitans rhizosphaerae]RZS36820.1 polyketide cyclase/dehydrase/lipid transport protein [Herbihabitans rhizosphaerae]